MAPSFDCMASFFCAEQLIESIWDEEEEEEEVVSDNDANNGPQDPSCFPFHMLAVEDDEVVAVLVEKEICHMPQQDYMHRLCSLHLDLDSRWNGINWIFNARATPTNLAHQFSASFQMIPTVFRGMYISSTSASPWPVAFIPLCTFTVWWPGIRGQNQISLPFDMLNSSKDTCVKLHIARTKVSRRPAVKVRPLEALTIVTEEPISASKEALGNKELNLFEDAFLPPGIDISDEKWLRRLPGSNIYLGTHAKDGQVKQAEFVKGSNRVADCPKDGLPEFTLAGRSNVGKSSLLNVLV